MNYDQMWRRCWFLIQKIKVRHMLAVGMETHIADTPGYSALLRGCRSLVGLALYTWWGKEICVYACNFTNQAHMSDDCCLEPNNLLKLKISVDLQFHFLSSQSWYVSKEYMLILKLRNSELTEIHDVVPADSTVIHHNVPGPQCHSIPLLGNQKQTNKKNVDLYFRFETFKHARVFFEHLH